MGEHDQRRYFFIHVMKTGGTTFRQHINANFAPEERYPETGRDPDMVLAKLSISRLLDLPEERHAETRIYTGHFPFVAAEMLSQDLTIFTILREPVARTISHLQQEQRAERGRSLEDLYEDPRVNPRLIGNHQVRLFALTPEDRAENFADVVQVDEARLRLACQNLACVDVIGLQDRFDEFVATVRRRYGWRAVAPSDMRVSDPVEVSPTFRARIAADNAADVAFYDHAVELCRARRRDG